MFTLISNPYSCINYIQMHKYVHVYSFSVRDQNYNGGRWFQHYFYLICKCLPWRWWDLPALLNHILYLYQCMHIPIQARIKKFFKGGEGWGGKFWKKYVCWYRYQRVYTKKTRKTCNSISLLPFQEDGLLFFFCFVLLLSFIFEIWKGGCNSSNPPPPRSANAIHVELVISISVS